MVNHKNPLSWIPLSFSPFFVVKLGLGVCISSDLQQKFLKTPLVHQSQAKYKVNLPKDILALAMMTFFTQELDLMSFWRKSIRKSHSSAYMLDTLCSKWQL